MGGPFPTTTAQISRRGGPSRVAGRPPTERAAGEEEGGGRGWQGGKQLLDGEKDGKPSPGDLDSARPLERSFVKPGQARVARPGVGALAGGPANQRAW